MGEDFGWSGTLAGIEVNHGNNKKLGIGMDGDT
jgi:hypothetical protein